MRYVHKKDVNRFAQFAVRIFNVDPDFDNPEQVALQGIERMKSFFKELGLPTSLKELNIFEDKFDEIAERSLDSGPIGNLVKLKKEDVINILKLAK